MSNALLGIYQKDKGTVLRGRTSLLHKCTDTNLQAKQVAAGLISRTDIKRSLQLRPFACQNTGMTVSMRF